MARAAARGDEANIFCPLPVWMLWLVLRHGVAMNHLSKSCFEHGIRFRLKPRLPNEGILDENGDRYFR